ncbi:MAG: polyhydroxyalkanoate synthesis regulator DNA-binding domain-containing protein [Anaerolineae bacterium]
MPLIKRYPNRKLYNTETKRYITLDGIAALIRQGHEVQVIDHTTGEDLTALTLSQIIFEQEKKRGGFLPHTVLAGLVRAGGETAHALRRALAHPLDFWRHVDEEIERRIEVLIRRGDLAEDEGLRLRDLLLALTRRPGDRPWPGEQDLARMLAERGVPTREDLQHLSQQVEALAARLEGLGQHPGSD